MEWEIFNNFPFNGVLLWNIAFYYLYSNMKILTLNCFLFCDYLLWDVLLRKWIKEKWKKSKIKNAYIFSKEKNNDYDCEFFKLKRNVQETIFINEWIYTLYQKIKINEFHIINHFLFGTYEKF